METKDHINKLRDILNQHNINYYVHDNPTISDYEYDQLLKKLELLESQYPKYKSDESPTQRVGGKVIREFNSITHRIPMQSLANAMDKEEVNQFNKQIMKLLNCTDSIEYLLPSAAPCISTIFPSDAMTILKSASATESSS